MPTGQTVINNSLTALNILDAGGAPSASESADLLAELNVMLDGWATDETLIPSIATAQYALTANQNPYPMGPGATAPFNVARPVRIDGAVLVSTVGAGATRKPLRIVGSKQYFAHGDLAAAATTADELYIDWGEASGELNLYFFPVPSCPTATKVELETWNPIAAFALGTNVALPPGYQDEIQQGLSFRCLSRYGAAVNPETAQIVATLGKSAGERIRKLNVQNRLLDPALLMPDPAQTTQQPQQQR
jgi:hypothetical protein